jgi:hypothetical protein
VILGQESWQASTTYFFFSVHSEVQGVTLPDAGDDFPAGTPAVVSGWGVTDSGSTSDVLMAVDVKIDSDAGEGFFVCLTN